MWFNHFQCVENNGNLPPTYCGTKCTHQQRYITVEGGEWGHEEVSFAVMDGWTMAWLVPTAVQHPDSLLACWTTRPPLSSWNRNCLYQPLVAWMEKPQPNTATPNPVSDHGTNLSLLTFTFYQRIVQTQLRVRYFLFFLVTFAPFCSYSSIRLLF